MTYSELLRKSPGNPLEMGSLCLQGENVLESKINNCVSYKYLLLSQCREVFFNLTLVSRCLSLRPTQPGSNWFVCPASDGGGRGG